MVQIVGISGYAGSGKDTLARMLAEKLREKDRSLNVKIIHFADSLKEYAAELFDVDISDLNDPTGKEKPYKNNKNITLRNILQILGTDIARKIDNNVWVRKTLQNAYKDDRDDIVTVVIIPDVRFYNEYLALQKKGTLFIRIERIGIKRPTIRTHISEWDLDAYPPPSEWWDLAGDIKWAYHFCVKRKCKARRIHLDKLVINYSLDLLWAHAGNVASMIMSRIREKE